MRRSLLSASPRTTFLCRSSLTKTHAPGRKPSANKSPAGRCRPGTRRLGLTFAKQPPQQEVRTSAFVNPLFVISPGANNYAVESAIQSNEDVQIFALFPHTHLRGKSWEYRLVYPDGRKEIVLCGIQ